MIRVLGARVLVALEPVKTEIETAGGIVLMRDPDVLRTPTRGIVMQLGHKSNTCDLDDVRSEVHSYFAEQAHGFCIEQAAHEYEVMRVLRAVGDEIDRVLMHLRPAPFDVQVGDVVLFLPTSGELLQEGDVEYALLHETEILAVVEQEQGA